jgi:hypothetical protein
MQLPKHFVLTYDRDIGELASRHVVESLNKLNLAKSIMGDH